MLPDSRFEKEYDINVEKLLEVKRFIFYKIKETGIVGCRIKDLNLLLNKKISNEQFFVTYDFLLELLDDLYKKCLIYKSSPYIVNTF